MVRDSRLGSFYSVGQVNLRECPLGSFPVLTFGASFFGDMTPVSYAAPNRSPNAFFAVRYRVTREKRPNPAVDKGVAPFSAVLIS